MASDEFGLIQWRLLPCCGGEAQWSNEQRALDGRSMTLYWEQHELWCCRSRLPETLDLDERAF